MEGGDEDDYSVNNDKVCRFFGEFLLSPTSGFNLSEFLEMWRQAVPEGLQTNIQQLDGLALVNSSTKPQTITRLSELFGVRSRWTLEEMRPFVQELTTEKLNVNALLTKFARPINEGGVKYFCAKHGK